MTQEIQAIVIELEKIRTKKIELNEEENLLWDRFFQIADDVAGEQTSYKFTHPENGITIAREMHNIAPRLNVDQLSQNLTDNQWEQISVLQRVFDISKLEEALAVGLIDKVLIEQYTERPAAVPHKKFIRPKAVVSSVSDEPLD